MPIPHRPGWYEPNHQHIKEIDLDIRIVPGWSKVPSTAVSELKVMTHRYDSQPMTHPQKFVFSL